MMLHTNITDPNMIRRRPIRTASWALSLLSLCLSGLFLSCDKSSRSDARPTDSTAMNVYQLSNADGLSMTITDFGGKVISLKVPDRNGEFADIVLGYDSVDQYPAGNPYFGALIGRFGNRIAKGSFVLDDDTVELAVNNGANALHGGPGGFHNVRWQARPFEEDGQEGLELTYESPDGEEGYPGTLTTTVKYLLNDDNELVIDYEARTTRATVVNMTHHSFFNLKGEGNGDMLGHRFELFADHFLPVDSGLIPTGEIRSVEGTPFDFRTPHAAGERIAQEDEQLTFGKGYDHCWVLTKSGDGDFSLAARVSEPESGRVLEVYTTEPGLQFYSGNFLRGSGPDVGKQGKPYPFRSAFCLEPQHFPDSPNKPEFPSTVLRPGQTYRQRTIYKFSVR